MRLKLVTGYHLCLTGEAFWIVDKGRKINGAPTKIDLLVPQYVNSVISNGELVESTDRTTDFELRIRPKETQTRHADAFKSR
jgi:hypothetical protein